MRWYNAHTREWGYTESPDPLGLVWPTIDEALLSVGVEPNTTPVDHLTEAAQWALVNQRFQWETDTSDENLSSDDRI